MVKCINTAILPGNRIAPALTHDAVYLLSQIHVCHCGEQHYDVGLRNDEIDTVTCYKCREVLPQVANSGITIHWAHSSRFIGVPQNQVNAESK